MSLLGGRKFLAALERMARSGQDVMFDALKRFSFEARDVIESDIGEALDYSGASTRKFISRYRVQYAKSREAFAARIYPAGRTSESLLARHVERYRQTPRDHADLLFEGKIAVPLSGVKRTARGRVRDDMKPAALVQRDARGRSRGFVSSRGLIMRRMARGKVKPAYALEMATVNPVQIDVQASFDRAVRTRGIVALAKALRKTVFG